MTCDDSALETCSLINLTDFDDISYPNDSASKVCSRATDLESRMLSNAEGDAAATSSDLDSGKIGSSVNNSFKSSHEFSESVRFIVEIRIPDDAD